MDNPIIFCDSREKKHSHILAYFDSEGIIYFSTKLFVGDYQTVDNAKFSIDRKQNLSEWVNCLFGQRRRFIDEVRRAHTAGITLAVLIEHGGQIKSIEDIKNWNNPMLKKYPNAVTGHTLMEETYRLHISRGIPIYFCDKRNTGKEIVRILTEAGHNNNG